MATLVAEARQAEPADEISTGPAFVLHRPGADAFDILRDEDGSFVVDGREARRAVALSDLGDVQALEVAHGRLKRLGVDRALARAGAQAGDTVHIGDLAFEYEPED
jgi:GTP-binding protein